MIAPHACLVDDAAAEVFANEAQSVLAAKLAGEQALYLAAVVVALTQDRALRIAAANDTAEPHGSPRSFAVLITQREIEALAQCLHVLASAQRVLDPHGSAVEGTERVLQVFCAAAVAAGASSPWPYRTSLLDGETERAV